MKANYTKPLLAMELFSLTQASARDCADIYDKDQITSNDPGTCTLDLGGGFTVFVGNPPCQYNGEEMDYGCYNNPTAETYIFRS